MPGLIRRESRGEAADASGRLDRMFEEWARMMPFRAVLFPRWWEAGDLIRVEEYRQDGSLVIRADLPGIDPDTDVELTVSGGMLHIKAERREEERREEKGYVRQEVRYGSLSRSLPLPGGVTGADITAT
jgi:HSP20 family protein